jgi:flagellar hook-basal body complex protein FliE
MAVLPVGAVTSPFAAPSVSGTSGIGGIGGIGTGAAAPTGFGEMLAKGVQNVTAAQENASVLSGQMATGELTDISDFTTAAAKASLGVSLTAAVRNRAIEAYQEIMRMQN